MHITLQDIAKRFKTEWVFRHVNYDFTPGIHGILGANGSGKSTLLQLIAGNQTPSEGVLQYKHEEVSLKTEDVYAQLSIAAPYLDLPEEFTLVELTRFHSQFKSLKEQPDAAEVCNTLGLAASKDKQVKNFSSGMKQRVKLGLAILSDTPLLLLDEPSNNLDAQGVDWFQQLLTQNSPQRTIIICSNSREEETFACKTQLQVEDFK